MDGRLRVSVVDDHNRLVESLRLAWGHGTPFRVLGPFAPGVAALRAEPDVIVVDLERPLTVNLALSPAAVIAGRVLNPSGQPAEGAAAQAIAPPQS